MAHLIKLEDYISRYQMDMQRYPTQFTRMKKEKWYYLQTEWEQLKSSSLDDADSWENDKEESSSTLWRNAFQKLKTWKFAKQSRNDEDVQIIPLIEEEEEKSLALKAENLNHLKQLFLDDLFQSQLKWASSSMLEHSYMNPKYKYDDRLRFFTQQLPDNFFLMYAPVFWIKQAPVDMDIIVITPSEIQCIATLEGREHSIFQASTERFWIELAKKSEKKVLSPAIALNRMASIISEIMKQHHYEFPIRKTVISRNCLIENRAHGLKMEIIDKRSFQEWHEKQKKHPSPIKSQQLKIAKLLLDFCHTSAHVRQKVAHNDEIEFGEKKE